MTVRAPVRRRATFDKMYLTLQGTRWWWCGTFFRQGDWRQGTFEGTGGWGGLWKYIVVERLHAMEASAVPIFLPPPVTRSGSPPPCTPAQATQGCPFPLPAPYHIPRVPPSPHSSPCSPHPQFTFCRCRLRSAAAVIRRSPGCRHSPAVPQGGGKVAAAGEAVGPRRFH